jgi:CRP/FNR family transcriptional regulator, cyclic AMP receptor protein
MPRGNAADNTDRLETMTEAVAEFERVEASGAQPGDRLVVPGWGKEEWAAILSYAQPVELEAGQVLIVPKEADRALFFVASGRLDVAATDERSGTVTQLGSVPAGSVLGELAFFDGGPRSAKAWAVAPTRLLRLTLPDYERYAAAHGADARAFLFAMARLLSFRVRRLTARL